MTLRNLAVVAKVAAYYCGAIGAGLSYKCAIELQEPLYYVPTVIGAITFVCAAYLLLGKVRSS
jgi:hypothetical protein